MGGERGGEKLEEEQGMLGEKRAPGVGRQVWASSGSGHSEGQAWVGRLGQAAGRGLVEGHRPNPVSLRPDGHLLSPMALQLARACRTKVGHYGFM